MASSVYGGPSLRLCTEVAEGAGLSTEGAGRTRVELRWTSGGATVDLGDQLLTCSRIVVSWSTTSLLLGARCIASRYSNQSQSQGFLVFAENCSSPGITLFELLFNLIVFGLLTLDFFVNEGALRGFERLLS